MSSMDSSEMAANSNSPTALNRSVSGKTRSAAQPFTARMEIRMFSAMWSVFIENDASTSTRLLRQSLEHGVTRVFVELDADPRPHIVRQFRELTPAGHWHEQRLGLLVDREFGDPHWIRH